MLRKHSLALLIVLLGICSPFVWAADDDFGTPIENNDTAIEEQINDASESAHNLSTKVKRLEDQIANPSSTQLVQRISQLEEQIQQLEGKIEEQNHAFEQLKQQVQASYVDLVQRINKIATDSVDIGKNKTAIDTTKPVDPIEQLTKGSQTKVSDNLENSSATSKQDDEEIRYLEAYKLVKSNHFEKALPLMQAFIKDFPRSHYAANAHYWVGEILVYQGNLDDAKKEFIILIEQFPRSTKIADARLKLANIYINQNLIEQARKELATIQKEFPDSPAARAAKDRLKDISE